MKALVPLRTGTIGVFAASSPFPRERYLAGRAALERAGFRVHEPEGLFDEAGYLAGLDEDRARRLVALHERTDIDALWAVRGGYGLARILPRLASLPLGDPLKPLLGFSDVTALHALHAARGLESIHGPVLTQLGDLGAETEARAFRLLAGEAPEPYTALGPALVGGRAVGPLVGGNLSVLISLLGTPFFPPLAGRILLLEDVGEATYRIDRMLTQLILSGVLAEVRGFALGEFTGCEPRKPLEPSVTEVLEERLSPFGVPTLAGLPFGHGQRNLAVVLGRAHELDADAGTLREVRA